MPWRARQGCGPSRYASRITEPTAQWSPRDFKESLWYEEGRFRGIDVLSVIGWCCYQLPFRAPWLNGCDWLEKMEDKTLRVGKLALDTWTLWNFPVRLTSLMDFPMWEYRSVPVPGSRADQDMPRCLAMKVTHSYYFIFRSTISARRLYILLLRLSG